VDVWWALFFQMTRRDGALRERVLATQGASWCTNPKAARSLRADDSGGRFSLSLFRLTDDRERRATFHIVFPPLTCHDFRNESQSSRQGVSSRATG
jgi:hypothetical protein